MVGACNPRAPATQAAPRQDAKPMSIAPTQSHIVAASANSRPRFRSPSRGGRGAAAGYGTKMTLTAFQRPHLLAAAVKCSLIKAYGRSKVHNFLHRLHLEVKMVGDCDPRAPATQAASRQDAKPMSIAPAQSHVVAASANIPSSMPSMNRSPSSISFLSSGAGRRPSPQGLQRAHAVTHQPLLQFRQALVASCHRLLRDTFGQHWHCRQLRPQRPRHPGLPNPDGAQAVAGSGAGIRVAAGQPHHGVRKLRRVSGCKGGAIHPAALKSYSSL
jgi:hypothetical protein